MRAARIHRYGGPEVLQIDEVDAPKPGKRDVLVRVCAAAVNPVDWKVRAGAQRSVMRYSLPWILGLDVSGVVAAVGSGVTRFRAGDAVWSSPSHRRPGTYAEYVAIDERELSVKPKNLTHEEAASMPLVGLTATQCLVEACQLKRGDRVLIHAGSGGVGAFGIQLAKHLGAHVITTTSAKNADFVRSLGADEVIDYRTQAFADVCDPVECVLDSLGEEVLSDNIRVLKKRGRMANITMNLGRHIERWGSVLGLIPTLGSLLRVVLTPWFKKGIRSRHVIKRCDGAMLETLAGWVEEGAIRPTIDKVYSLGEIAEAHRHSESHHARGKIVIHVADG